MALVVSVLLAFGLGWFAATLAGTATRSAIVPPPATATAQPSPTTTETSTVPVSRVGFAEPTISAQGLEVMSVLTKIKGGVDVTLMVQNQGNTPITVDNASLGPHDVTFRGQPVPMELAPVRKKLVPGEALVYPCRVHLPDMNVGELSFTMGGVPISGPAAGD
jgi:hypothetical protein